MRRYFQSFVLLLMLPVGSMSQSPIADIRHALKSLTSEQKTLALEYLRSLGSGIDDEIQNSYRQTSEQAKAKTVLLVDWLRLQNKQVQLASVTWDQDTIFFPDTPEGDLLTGSFRMTNTGAVPYLIRQNKTTCDCTALNVPKHPIMPGETAEVHFEFDTSGKLGIAAPALIIYDNSTPNQRKILHIKSNILARKKPRKYPWND